MVSIEAMRKQIAAARAVLDGLEAMVDDLELTAMVMFRQNIIDQFLVISDAAIDKDNLMAHNHLGGSLLGHLKGGFNCGRFVAGVSRIFEQ